MLYEEASKRERVAAYLFYSEQTYYHTTTCSEIWDYWVSYKTEDDERVWETPEDKAYMIQQWLNRADAMIGFIGDAV